MLPTCALLILNWNGESWLRRCLGSMVASAGEVGADVIVVDNNSSDGSAAACAELFPTVKFWNMGYNKVLAAYNDAAKRCDHDVIVLLNNDIETDRNFLRPLLEWFADSSVFSASPAMCAYPPTNPPKLEFGAETANWTLGMLRQVSRETAEPCPTYFTSGGAMAVVRERFLALGGIDEIFFPTYSDDRDLCFRAWKHGWRCVFDPRAVVYHAGGSTMGRSAKTTTLMGRNDILFLWKNLDTPWLIVHVLVLPFRAIGALVRGRWPVFNGICQALRRLPAARASRKISRTQRVLTDREVVARINSPATFKPPVAAVENHP